MVRARPTIGLVSNHLFDTPNSWRARQRRLIELDGPNYWPFDTPVEVSDIRRRDEDDRELANADGGTEITILCGDHTKRNSAEDNELGCKESLQKLAALLE